MSQSVSHNSPSHLIPDRKLASSRKRGYRLAVAGDQHGVAGLGLAQGVGEVVVGVGGGEGSAHGESNVGQHLEVWKLATFSRPEAITASAELANFPDGRRVQAMRCRPQLYGGAPNWAAAFSASLMEDLARLLPCSDSGVTQAEGPSHREGRQRAKAGIREWRAMSSTRAAGLPRPRETAARLPGEGRMHSSRKRRGTGGKTIVWACSREREELSLVPRGRRPTVP